ncbi:hypothetical protein H0I39_01770 [Ottowia beijingensis]|uniref:Uncharacterized protein n=1 Tax=Ottowia beijingensis TaxID=1207057 RepID=A0A853IT26_9BURK|nr:hypothetical protein [Ottowia beijingensis]NZA00824.1 hypothetical protein [Ottowia beijingensis]
MPLHQDPTRFPDGKRRAAAWLLGLGAAGVLATCVSYVLAGAPAALPGGAPDFESVRAATAAAAGWMRAAGSFGMPGDVLLVAGCVLLAGAARRAGTAAGAVGWGCWRCRARCSSWSMRWWASCCRRWRPAATARPTWSRARRSTCCSTSAAGRWAWARCWPHWLRQGARWRGARCAA